MLPERVVNDLGNFIRDPFRNVTFLSVHSLYQPLDLAPNGLHTIRSRAVSLNPFKRTVSMHVWLTYPEERLIGMTT